MSTYELDDDLVRSFVEDAWAHPTASVLAGKLEKQLPIAPPTKVGAVVRTEKGTLIRVALDGVLSEWWLMNKTEFSHDIDAHWIPTEDIGRITEVLSEGVDL